MVLKGPPSEKISASPDPDGNVIAGRYQIFGDNNQFIRDTVYEYEWQRCSVGQNWDQLNNACGVPSFWWTVYN